VCSNPPMTKTAYSYIRFSSAAQQHGRSEARQIEACERYCLENDLKLAENDYRFLDAGVSGWKGDHLGERGQLARFIGLVEDGSIEQGSVLIVESLDRLSREQVTKALSTFLQIISLGIEIVTLIDNKVYRKGGSDIDLVMSIFIMSRAHDESATKSKRVRDAFAKKHELARSENKPMGETHPLWLKLSKDRTKYLLVPERVEIIKRVFQLTIDGYGKIAIAKALNIDGLPAFKGDTWASSSIEDMLSNRAVMGEYQPNSVQVSSTRKKQKSGEPIINYFPAIIDEDTFYQAKAAIEGRRLAKATKQTINFNVWQGIAKCTLCHGAMHMVNKGAPPKHRTYLRCYKASKGLCESKATRQDAAEMVFKELLTMLDSKSLIQDDSTKISKIILTTSSKVSEKKQLLGNYALAFADNPTNTVNALLGKTEHEISNLEEELISLRVLLAEEKNIGKKDFLEKLDLVSYEGRNRANILLKKLGILVYIGAGYVVTQKHSDLKEEAVWIMAHHAGKVSSFPTDDYSEYTGGGDIAAQGLLGRMKHNRPFLDVYDYKTSAINKMIAE